ncbi:hypothetical protein ACFSE1_09060 [Rhizobium helianthi]|uniref:Uncharacterized protein n=1 Tax=Rhizobium helianthi TaxID=1132695 RepID=A0ABW4M4P1_9HYPH
MLLRSLFIGLIFAASSLGSAIDVSARQVRYEVKSQPLTQVIDVLADLSGTPAQKLGEIPGKIENWIADGDGLAVFQQLAKDANLFLAYDGSRVIIASRTDTKTTILPLGNYDWPSAQAVVKSLYPIMPKDTLRFDAKAGVLSVRGPAVFNDTIAAILARPQNTTVKVIRGGNVQDLDLQQKR